ncbi:uncharacterized protein I303_105823 [Kwoniella dejecticola CBS 10117]|uniref:Mitochondrial intermembrane space import and assembly protein 40 n=1 Tax=Kwoniella dejecticola CBS 10117 TaxID=1296121 RepID=A0A1A6A0H3_9TREE|nr:uncharacterized protein I303_05845 [Kwoniella dejecticola CBS 10117]OBR83565.1 hypothetical protein I303_05845 [Kwoniella dejecticola CBS 10117]
MLSRSAARSFRSLSAQIPRRSLSTSTPSASSSSSTFSRNAAIGLTTFVVAGLTITSERRRVLNDDRVRESVLDQGSLKEPIHKRESASKPSTSSDTDKIKEQTSALSDKASDVKDQVVERSHELKSKATEKSEEVRRKTDEVKEKVSDKAQEVKSKIQNSADDAPATVAHVVEEKSAEAAQPSQGAFNEETGEINWDCPCLGGMADGPCGEQFKEAFSCFIYSEAEPKGVDCVEKFKHMQDCFREHPEIYGEEIDDDDDELDLADVPNPADEGVTIKEDSKAPPS